MIINQHILPILKTFSNLQKIYEKLRSYKTISKAATNELFSKIPNREQASNENIFKRDQNL